MYREINMCGWWLTLVVQANEVLPVVHHTPVLAGVCASDPFRNIPRFLRQLKEIGIVGVQVCTGAILHFGANLT